MMKFFKVIYISQQCRVMPTFTAIALDWLIEPGASKSMTTAKNVPESKLYWRNGNLNSKVETGMETSNSKLEGRNSTSTAATINKKHHWAPIRPALYATPEVTPLPDSPSSFPPSPYIINHKRRGPRLLKSHSEDNVAARKQALEEEKVDENAEGVEKDVTDSAKDIISTVTMPSPVEEEHVNGICDGDLRTCDSGNNSTVTQNGSAVQNGSMKPIVVNVEEGGELEDFLDPQESLSVKSNTEGESNSGLERSFHLNAPTAEFFDAWEGSSNIYAYNSSSMLRCFVFVL